MGKHRYNHTSQRRPTCANPPAQGRCNYGKSSFSRTCLPLQLPCHPVQNSFLGYKEVLLASLPSAGLSRLVFAGQNTTKGTSVQEVHLYCSTARQMGSLTRYCKRPGTKQSRVWGPSSVPTLLAYIPLTLYLLEIFPKPFGYLLVCL